MTHPTRMSVVPAVLLAVALGSSPALALNTRSFVASFGSDASTCARTQPCRTLQVAHDKTVAGGEVNMIDVAGFGTLVITKSLSVVNDGVGSAGVLVPPGVDGVTVNAGSNDIVNLRGLMIEGAGIGGSGITILSAKAVTIQRCTIHNLVNHGIVVLNANPVQVTVSDTYIAGVGLVGVVVQPTGTTTVTAVLNRLEVYNSGSHGIAPMGNQTFGVSKMTVIDTISAQNGGHGFYVYENSCSSGNSSVLQLIRVNAHHNAPVGVEADGSCASLVLTGATLLDYPFPYALSNGATGSTYGDNAMQGWGDDLTPIARR